LDQENDVRALNEAGYDQSEGKHRLSWIWLAQGVTLNADGKEGDEHVHDSKLGVVCIGVPLTLLFKLFMLSG
jgi:hypothetical protein